MAGGANYLQTEAGGYLLKEDGGRIVLTRFLIAAGSLTLPARSIDLTLPARSIDLTLPARSVALTLPARSVALTLPARSIDLTLRSR